MEKIAATGEKSRFYDSLLVTLVLSELRLLGSGTRPLVFLSSSSAFHVYHYSYSSLLSIEIHLWFLSQQYFTADFKSLLASPSPVFVSFLFFFFYYYPVSVVPPLHRTGCTHPENRIQRNTNAFKWCSNNLAKKKKKVCTFFFLDRIKKFSEGVIRHSWNYHFSHIARLFYQGLAGSCWYFLSLLALLRWH